MGPLASAQDGASGFEDLADQPCLQRILCREVQVTASCEERPEELLVELCVLCDDCCEEVVNGRYRFYMLGITDKVVEPSL